VKAYRWGLNYGLKFFKQRHVIRVLKQKLRYYGKDLPTVWKI